MYKNYRKALFLCCLAPVLFISCIIQNVPDDFEIIHASEPMTVYQQFTRTAYEETGTKIYLEYANAGLINPEQAMKVEFWYLDMAGYKKQLDLAVRLYTAKQYKKLYIKEISYVFNGKFYNLISDQHFGIPAYRDSAYLVDKNHEPILINGEKRYWDAFKLNKQVKHHFIPGSRGQVKEIELIQIYSFDDEPLREEKYKYIVICGGARFEPMMLLMWMATR